MNSDMLVEEFEHAGLNVKIYGESCIDEHDNPRYGVDGLLGVMVTAHRSYNLGGGKNDENMSESPDFEIECSRCEGSGDDPERFGLWRGLNDMAGAGTEESMNGELAILQRNGDPKYDDWCVEPVFCIACNGNQIEEVDPITYYKRTQKARVVLLLDFYEHSGCSISAREPGTRAGYPFNCQWDAGIVGVIFDTPETLKECGWEDKTDKEIAEGLILEVSEYNKYLTGEIYIIDIDGDDDTPVGGYLGYEYAMEEAKSMADCHRKWLDKQTQEHIDNMPAMGV